MPKDGKLKLELLAQELESFKDEYIRFKRNVTENYIHKFQFIPVRNISYGTIGLIITLGTALIIALIQKWV